MGDVIPDVLHSSSSSSSSVMKAGTLPEFLDQWRSITSHRFVLNVSKGHHLSLDLPHHYSVISDSLT